MWTITEVWLLIAGIVIDAFWLLLGTVSMKDVIVSIHTFFAAAGPAWMAWLGSTLIVAAALWWLARRFVWHLPSRYEFEFEFSEPRNEDARDGRQIGQSELMTFSGGEMMRRSPTGRLTGLSPRRPPQVIPIGEANCCVIGRRQRQGTGVKVVRNMSFGCSARGYTKQPRTDQTISRRPNLLS